MTHDFYKYQAQTGTHPLGLQVKKASGSYIYDQNNKPYLDFIAGVSACTLGHSHPDIVKAITEQAKTHLHVMVYGEFIQESSVKLAKKMAELLPSPLETTYFTNSGTEATEGSIKLAKRATGRHEIIAAQNAYHGNTMGAMSVMGYETRKKPFRPLVPGSHFIAFNSFEDLQFITSKTAAVILETIQGGAGFITPIKGYLEAVKNRCSEVGALLILDEIQSGIGRTGKFFGFEHYQCVPDILISGKGLGGGMPIGAFTASRALMSQLSKNPTLGHITTFGGHPVITAAGLATLNTLENSSLIEETLAKESLIRKSLKHPLIKEIRGKGLMLAILLDNANLANKLILKAYSKGLILFWLLFEPKAVRITPPLTISYAEIEEGCSALLEILNEIQSSLN